ncbi:MAG TPA: C39 family peptidase [Chthoniobacteraceae bacterium]|nr:C39 family peptidase [Chthoniobacteraceae bacterium]
MNSRRLRKAALLFVLLGTLTALVLMAHIYRSWGDKCVIAPSGGRYFFHRVELAVPSFRQADERWRADLLGPTHNTLGAEGCAVASAAMVLASYGYDTDPQRLNDFLKSNGGFTPQGWLYWEKAAELAGGRVRHAYEDLPSYDLIDGNLARGNPVIVRLRTRSRITHFVVIAGKQGFDYLTRDPGAGAAKGMYPLREFGSRIEALRFYEKAP